MALLTWNSNYAVGVKPMDSQHTVLFGLLNDLHAAMASGQAQSMTGPLLRKLVDYTHTHFAAEETMMTVAKYPGLAEHKVKHRELLKQVEEFAARFERGEAALNIDLMNFLRDWLTNHIEKVDHAYGPWVNKQGVH